MRCPYDGLWWTYRALGDSRLTAAAAESAPHRDSTPTWYARHVESQLGILLMNGDTASLWRFASEQRSSYPAVSTARFWWAFFTTTCRLCFRLRGMIGRDVRRC